jgi:GT2 family glycosyltransferase
MIKLSVVIITLNEEKNIARCLKSVEGLADEVAKSSVRDSLNKNSWDTKTKKTLLTN